MHKEQKNKMQVCLSVTLRHRYRSLRTVRF